MPAFNEAGLAFLQWGSCGRFDDGEVWVELPMMPGNEQTGEQGEQRPSPSSPIRRKQIHFQPPDGRAAANHFPQRQRAIDKRGGHGQSSAIYDGMVQ